MNGGFGLSRIIGAYLQNVQLSGVLARDWSPGVLLVASVIASVRPTARAARVDVVQALRAE